MLDDLFEEKDCGVDTCYAGNLHNFLWGGSLYEPETDLYWMRNRYYHIGMHRFINQDPIGIWGDANNLGNGFAYVAGMVIEASDPSGLETEVIFWDSYSTLNPWSWKSAFGHLSININGTSYSWNTNDVMDIRPADEYFKRNGFRDGEGIVLNITEEEEADLEESLFKYTFNNIDWSPVDNNCTAPITSWINKNFDKKIKSYLPSNVKKEIVDNGLGKQTVEHVSENSKPQNDSNSSGNLNSRTVILYWIEITEEEEYMHYSDQWVNGEYVIVAEKRKRIVVKQRIPVYGQVNYHPVPGENDPADKIQAALMQKLIEKMLKQGENDQPPLLKDDNTGPNGAIMFFRNPYYINKDPMKTLIIEGHSGRGFMFVRNPFAPKNGVIWANTYEMWQMRGIIQPEVDPWE